MRKKQLITDYKKQIRRELIAKYVGTNSNIDDRIRWKTWKYLGKDIDKIIESAWITGRLEVINEVNVLTDDMLLKLSKSEQAI